MFFINTHNRHCCYLSRLLNDLNKTITATVIMQNSLCKSAHQISLLQGFSMYMSIFSIRTAEVLWKLITARFRVHILVNFKRAMLHCVSLYDTLLLEIDRYIDFPIFFLIFKHFTIIGYRFCNIGFTDKFRHLVVVLRIACRIAIAARLR